jgi:hypothetical protein
MRTTICVLIILLASGCHNLQKEPNTKYVKQITSKYVDFDIETFIDIDCEQFEKQFINRINTNVITESNKINEILTQLKDLKIAGEDQYQHVDTRMTVELKYNSDSIETIWISNSLVERNGKLFVKTDSLTRLLIKKE